MSAVDRLLAEREQQGFPPTVTDPAVLAVVAAAVARHRGGDDRA